MIKSSYTKILSILFIMFVFATKAFCANPTNTLAEVKIDITAKNIIVYKLENYTIAGDRKGRQFLENIGEGTGYFISEGKAVKINWQKESRESKTKYTLENGQELVVNDGNTFIQIVPLDGKVEIK